MNASLRGYTVRIAKLRFEPIGGAVTLEDVQVRQVSHPEPALAQIPRLRASVQWRELLRLRVVADFLIEGPRVHMNLEQLRSEVSNEVPVERRGWQEAVGAIYPLKINLLRIDEGTVTYVDDDPKRPLRLTHWSLRAANIRNVHSRRRTYPSALESHAVVFESGRASFSGQADFLAEPHPGVQGKVRFSGIPLDRLGPVAAHWNLETRGGTLSASGEIEYAPGIRRAIVPDLELTGVRIDYVRRPAGRERPGLLPAQSSPAAERNPPSPRWELRLDRLRLRNGEFGYRDQTRKPEYRVFLSKVEVDVSGLDRAAGGTAEASLRGRFMNSGAATANVRARFPRGRKGADFDARLSIQSTDVRTLNDLFRAHGKFDLFAGSFSLFSDIRVHDGVVDGYVKPLFTDVEVYDSRQDARKGVLKKIYEGAVDAVSGLLENKQETLATNIVLQGPVGDPESNTLQVIAKLIENAFIKAILPGFDVQVPRPRR